MTIRIEAIGRRHYIVGHTYPHRDILRSASCHWDGDRKAWWTGKRDDAERLAAKIGEVAKAAAQDERESGIDSDARVIRGRAKYRGKIYYILAIGTSHQGKPYAKLCSRDGSLVFWAREGEPVEVVKTYEEATSIAALRAYAERMKRERESGDDDESYRSDDYMVTRDGRHLVRVYGPRGAYWRPASERDEYNEFG